VVYNEVEPGVVDVTANLQYLQETAKGTGFVIDAAAGLVLTNNHVIDGRVIGRPRPDRPAGIPRRAHGGQQRSRLHTAVVTLTAGPAG
jgi:S1-C subfamily serine protease